MRHVVRLTIITIIVSVAIALLDAYLKGTPFIEELGEMFGYVFGVFVGAWLMLQAQKSG